MTSRILFAWELGANYGHLSRSLPVALSLRERGHDVLFAVTDTRTAAEMFAGRDFPVLQALMLKSRIRSKHPPVTYADILLAEGYADRFALQGAAQAWRALLDLSQPDLIVIDHSPTALLAARIARLPAVALGNGFEIPPPTHPSPIDATADLFAAATRVFASFPELDHYGARDGERYVGPIHALAHARRIEWMNSGGRKVFAYLRPAVPGFDALMSALSKLPAEVVCVVPELESARRGTPAGTRGPRSRTRRGCSRTPWPAAIRVSRSLDESILFVFQRFSHPEAPGGVRRTFIP